MTDLQKEYKRVRKNLLAKRRRLIKKGKKAPDIPNIPKKITQGSINKLNKISTSLSKRTASIKTPKIKVPKIKAPKINIPKSDKKKDKKQLKKNKGKKKKIDKNIEIFDDDYSAEFEHYPSQTNHVKYEFLDRISQATTLWSGSSIHQVNFAERVNRVMDSFISKYGEEEIANRLEDNMSSGVLENCLEDIERYMIDSNEENYRNAASSLIEIMESIMGEMPDLDELKELESISEELQNYEITGSFEKFDNEIYTEQSELNNTYKDRLGDIAL